MTMRSQTLLAMCACTFAACAGPSTRLAPDPRDHPANPSAAAAPLAARPTALEPDGDDAARHEHPGTDGTAPSRERARTFACPMHPDVTSNEPGQCPKCGMTLVETKANDHPHA